MIPDRAIVTGNANRNQVTTSTCLENLETSGNLTAVREMSMDLTKNQGNVRGENLVREKLPKTIYCKLSICVHTGVCVCVHTGVCVCVHTGVGVYSVLNVKYMASDHVLLHSYPHH